MKGLKNSYLIAHLCQVSGAGQARRTGTNYGNSDAVGFLWLCRNNTVFSGPVSHKALQLSDGNRLALDTADTFSLALAFLRADAAADGGKGTGLCDGR